MAENGGENGGHPMKKMVEEKLNCIITGVKSMEEVIEEVKTLFLNLFDRFLANKNYLENEVKNQIKKVPLNLSLSQRTPTLTSSLCPFCLKNPMKFINLKGKRFLVCADQGCKKYLSLPKKGRLELLNSQCKLCGFNIFKVSLRKNNKTFIYYLCPKCWNEGLNEKSGKGFCSGCESFKIVNDKCVEK